MSKQETIDKLDILSIEKACSHIIGRDVEVLWSMDDTTLYLNLSWGGHTMAIAFRHLMISQSKLSLSNMVSEAFKNRLSFGVPPEQLGLNSKCGPTTCTDVSHKCCNQFGERDEIQTIINSLQADVVARGNRITELERALQGEQRKSEQLYNLALELGACSEFMKVNFACEWVGDVDD